MAALHGNGETGGGAPSEAQRRIDVNGALHPEALRMTSGQRCCLQAVSEHSSFSRRSGSSSSIPTGQDSCLLSPRLLAAQETIALWSKRGAPGLEGGALQRRQSGLKPFQEPSTSEARRDQPPSSLPLNLPSQTQLRSNCIFS